MRALSSLRQSTMAPSYDGFGTLRATGSVLRSTPRSRSPAPWSENAALPPLRLPSQDALEWRRQVRKEGSVLQLDDLLADLWDRGIPVIHVKTLPAPGFQGLACIVDGRPVIVLAHDLDQPARIAFILAHEVAHLVFGDCAPDQPVVDENEEISDDHAIEVRADRYATDTTTGGADVPDVQAAGYKDLAQKAADAEQERGVDASAVIWAWARKTGDYAKAQMAAEALYRTKGGKRSLRSHLDRHVDLPKASDSDRALLACLHGDPDSDAAAS